MQWGKLSAAGLFVIGLSVPALLSAPDVATAGISINVYVGGSGGYGRPYGGYARPYGGVRRAARGVGRAVVGSQVRRKVRSKIRKKLR